MKAFRFYGMVLLTVLLSVSLTSCGDDDDIGNVSNLYGTWQTSYSEGWSKTNGEITDDWMCECVPGYAGNQYSIRLKFSGDGTVTEYEYQTGGTWRIEDTYKYSLKGNKLYIEDYYGDGDDGIFTVKSLSSSQLVLEEYYSGTYDNGDKYEDYYKETYQKVE